MRAALLFAALALAAACDKKEERTPGGTSGLAAPSVVPTARGGARARLDTAEIAVPTGKSSLRVAWSVPSGTEINDEAPFAVRWTSSDGLVTPPADIQGRGKDVRTGFEVPIEIMPDAAGGKLSGDLDIVVCDDVTHSVCVPIKRSVELTFAVNKGGAPGHVTLPLPQAKP